MNASLALHTAARRYCLGRHAFWCQRYSEIVRKKGDRQRNGYYYTPEALATFPRYNVLNAIRVELERIDPAKLGEPEDTRVLLILAGETALDDFTQLPIGEIDERAMAEERSEYCRYIGGLELSDLMQLRLCPIGASLPRRNQRRFGRGCVLVGKSQRAIGFLWLNASCLMSSPSRPDRSTKPSRIRVYERPWRRGELSIFGSFANTVRSTRKTWRCSSRITMGPKATGLPAA